MLLVMESQPEGSSAPSIRSLVADEQRWGQASVWGQCFVFSSVLWHCCSGDR